MADDDLNQVVREMAHSLNTSDFLRSRGPDAPRATIVIDRVENLSSDLLTMSEQWMLMARVRDSLPLRELSSTRNIHFQISPQRWETLVDSGQVHGHSAGGGPEPHTHLMTATLRSARRAGTSPQGNTTDLRSDIYFFAFQIVTRQSRELVWSDNFAFKRDARGVVID